MLSWDPQHYGAFARERTRPGLDLINRIPAVEPRTVVDLGCGTGHLTHELARRFPNAHTLGIDRSAEMLEAAPAGPAEFAIGDIESWNPDEPTDLVYANASLHWIPDHQRLFPRLIAALAQGGVLAVQMPLSWDMPSHQAIRKVAGDYGVEIGEPPTLAAAAYVDLLLPLAGDVDIFTTTYFHVLEGDNPVFHWVSATGIKRFLNRIDEVLHAEFLTRCAAEIAERYPPRPDGLTIYPFDRLFLLLGK